MTIEPSPARLSLTSPERLTSLIQTRLLDSAPEPVFDRLTRLASRLLDAPVSLVSLVDDHRQFFKSQCGLPSPWSEDRQTPLSHSFCQYVVTDAAPLVIRDARQDPRLKHNLAIQDLDVVAYLGIPILTTEGHVIGSFCAIDNEPRHWADDDIDTMRDLARFVESEIALRKVADDRKAALASNELLIGELNHRVKNLFAMISGMINLTARNSETPKDMATVLRGRVLALSRAHSLVRPKSSDDPDDDARGGLSSLVDAIFAPHQLAGEIIIDGEDHPLSVEAAVPLSLVLHELSTNMVKYGSLSRIGGKLDVNWRVKTEVEEPRLVLTWDEHHPELSLVERDPAAKGFGDRLVQSSVKSQLGGTIHYDWRKTGLKVVLDVPQSRLLPKSSQRDAPR